MMHNNSSLIAFSKIPNPTKFQKTLGVNDFYFGRYVVDSSFFVSSTAVNPTLTIIANALRVAGRLGATSLPEAQDEAQNLVTAHA
jgi:hypothetical protein